MVMKSLLKSERGIALYLVLWVMALLTVIAGEFAYAIRTEANITRNFKEETQAYYLATSGVSWAVKELIVNDIVPQPVQPAEAEETQTDVRVRINTNIPPVPFGVGQFKVEIENESGKVNLNRAGEPLLRILLNTFALDDDAKNIIVDSIMDWRDKDNLHRVNGAEDEYYQSLAEPYKCKNGDFTAIEELLLVRGVTPAIFYGGLRDMISVYQTTETPIRPGSPRKVEVDFTRININAGSPQLLHSLPLMTEDSVQEILKYREKKDFRSLAELIPIVGAEIYTAISPYVTLTMSPYYTIKASGILAESRTRQGVQAVVKIDRTLPKGYAVIQWIDNLEYRS